MPASTVYKRLALSRTTEGCVVYPSGVAQQTAEVERLNVISLQVMEDSSGDKGLTHPRRSVEYDPRAIYS
jgi:hypothetical protein